MERLEVSAVKEIATRISLEESKGSSLTEVDIWKIKLDVCKEFRLDRVPKNSEILEHLGQAEREILKSRLMRKTVRTSSGIAVVTAITKPFNCPHGTCSFCPGGLRFGTPQSYTKNSPAVVFGLARGYDPKRQVNDMLRFLRENGHDTSKIEMILLGGTILAMPKDYQQYFVKSCYDALNDFESPTLEESILTNEGALHRCVGLTIETKPDWCKQEHLDTLLSYGTTRVELGVQSLREEVLKAVNRGHSLKDTEDAFRLSRDSCLKLVAHMMPGLPESDPDKDLEDLLTLVNDEKYKPDMLKIYPTLVVEGTALHGLAKVGKYSAYTTEQLVEILSEFKRRVPPWLRIMRIQREIPKEEIAGGNAYGNLRQLVLNEMRSRNYICRCIRCREIGHRKSSAINASTIKLKKIEYDASGGKELFLSYEDDISDSLIGFLRLRIPSGAEYRPEIRDCAALVRELHVYGKVVPIGEKANPESGQHHGMGTRLLREAETIAKEFSRKKLVVISAVGTREYYRRRGYRDDGPYVSKSLSDI